MILLDTNVLSELVKPRPEPRVVTWTRHSAAALAIPTIAVAEMAFGIKKLAEGQRREDLLAGLHRVVTSNSAASKAELGRRRLPSQPNGKLGLSMNCFTPGGRLLRYPCVGSGLSPMENFEQGTLSS